MTRPAIKVLLVDDDEDDFVITRDLISGIRDQRYQLDWADSFRAALEAISRAEHDIALLDYRLGERTGLELLRETAGLAGRPPIILLTGQGDHEVDLAAMEAGAADYLIKGQLTSDTLDRAIRYAVERKRAEQHLRRERDLISRIMQTSPVGILTTDRTGKLTFANQRAAQVLGLPEGDVAQSNIRIGDWQLADWCTRADVSGPVPLQAVLESGETVKDLRFALRLANGRHALLSTNATPIYDTSGTRDGLVVTLDDVTERVNLELQLQHSQRMESIGQLAAGVAHDINNVLTIIQGHAGLLLERTPADAPSARSLSQIAAAADRAARFVRQLLLFSRKQVLQPRRLDLNEVLTNLEPMLGRLLSEPIALETHYATVLPQIEADVGMVEQVVMNLAVNARDAMPKGGRLRLATAEVTVDAAGARVHAEAREGRFVCLTVADTGCGMDRVVLEHIFEPFFTTKEIGKGTGLGLATVYGIVKQHQGWVDVTSEPGRGTTFHVYFPVAASRVEPGVKDAPDAPAVRGGTETILLVEDEPLVREMVRTVLSEYHYNILEAGDGVEALAVWEQHQGQIDLLVTDMVMPAGISGRELADRLWQRKPDLKVLFTSGYSPDLVDTNLGSDDTRFLSKPYRPEQLAERVRHRLDTAARERDPRPCVLPPLPRSTKPTKTRELAST